MSHEALTFWIIFGSTVGGAFIVVLLLLIYINSRDNL